MPYRRAPHEPTPSTSHQLYVGWVASVTRPSNVGLDCVRWSSSVAVSEHRFVNGAPASAGALSVTGPVEVAPLPPETLDEGE